MKNRTMGREGVTQASNTCEVISHQQLLKPLAQGYPTEPSAVMEMCSVNIVQYSSH